MARRKRAAKKVVGDKVFSFTLKEFDDKLQAFLEKNDACDNDWIRKVKAEFLGHKTYDVVITANVKSETMVTVTAENEQAAAALAETEMKKTMNEGEFNGWDVDDFTEYDILETKAIINTDDE